MHNVIVSIHKRHESTPRDIIYRLLVHRVPIFRVIVVDDDINVYDPEEVDWAVMSRVLISKDIHMMPPQGAPGPDPFNTNRWGIDATAPMESRKYYRVNVPGTDKVDYV